MHIILSAIILAFIGIIVFYKISQSVKFQKFMDGILNDESPEKSADDLINEKEQLKAEADAKIEKQEKEIINKKEENKKLKKI